jgi:phenylpropionate dioxygenase-like ring-hydroxylating dioxygenase large terminal subunit
VTLQTDRALGVGDLARVGKGTPTGEWFRKHWLVVGVAAELRDIPRAVRILGEDLVLFRDGAGRPGLLGLHCPHRDTSLEYGDIEERGIRCCYHGWLFDCEGRCLEQPAEPKGSQFYQRVRHLWYPVLEQGGLLFAHLGSDAEHPPPLPEYEPLVSPVGRRQVEPPRHLQYNWFNFFENAPDPNHISILHRDSAYGEQTWGNSFFSYDDIPSFEPFETPYGVKVVLRKPAPSPDTDFVDTMVAAFPSIIQIGDTEYVHVRVADASSLADGSNNTHILFLTPCDDESFLTFTVDHYRGPDHEFFEKLQAKRALEGPKLEARPHDTREHTPFKGSVRREDVVAQSTQRPVGAREVERLGASDRGVILLRRLLLEEIAATQQGARPRGVLPHDAADRRIAFDSFVGLRPRDT